MGTAYAYQEDQLVWICRDLLRQGSKRTTWTGPWAIGSALDFQRKRGAHVPRSIDAPDSQWWNIRSLFISLSPTKLQLESRLIRPFDRRLILTHCWITTSLIKSNGPVGNFLEVLGQPGPGSLPEPVTTSNEHVIPNWSSQEEQRQRRRQYAPMDNKATVKTTRRRKEDLTRCILTALSNVIIDSSPPPRPTDTPSGEEYSIVETGLDQDALDKVAKMVEVSEKGATIDHLAAITEDEVARWEERTGVNYYLPVPPYATKSLPAPPHSSAVLKDWFQKPQKTRKRSALNAKYIRTRVEGRHVMALVDTRIVPTLMSSQCVEQLPAFLPPKSLPVNIRKGACPEDTAVTYVNIDTTYNDVSTTCHHPVLIAESLSEEHLVLGTHFLRRNLTIGFEEYYQGNADEPVQ